MAGSFRLKLEELETRTTPAATAAVLGGVLTVIGDGPDRINVFLQQGQLIVTDHGLPLGSFDPATVNSIKIQGGNGGDIIRIAQSVTQPATILGGAGFNDLEAGGGPTTLNNQLGTRGKLYGGPASDTLLGGAGPDLLNGRGGVDTLDGGPGANKLIHVFSGDLVTAHPGDQVSPLFDPTTAVDPGIDVTDMTTINTTQVQQLLDRASAATPSQDAIIAIVDRNGRILGVRVEDGVSPLITGNPASLTFAIDGAVAEARTGAFFGNAGAPLTSRTIEFISQSTITEREVDSNPSITDPNSTLRGPGFVAPVGINAHFPPDVANTPQVDLFDIEGTNRDTTDNPGPDGIIGTADDIPLAERFNIDPAYVPPGQTLFAPVSYGRASGLQPLAEGRGIGTLPGGIPIYLPDANGNPAVVGGIGVFFPGTTGYATEENSSLSTTYDPKKPDRSLEAEYIAFAAVGGAPGIGIPIGTIAGIPPVPGTGLPLTQQNMRIDLVGITLDIVGPGGIQGPGQLAAYGKAPRHRNGQRHGRAGDHRRGDAPERPADAVRLAGRAARRRRHHRGGRDRHHRRRHQPGQQHAGRHPPAARQPCQDGLRRHRPDTATSSACTACRTRPCSRSTWPWPRPATSPITPTRPNCNRGRPRHPGGDRHHEPDVPLPGRPAVPGRRRRQPAGAVFDP